MRDYHWFLHVAIVTAPRHTQIATIVNDGLCRNIVEVRALKLGCVCVACDQVHKGWCLPCATVHILNFQDGWGQSSMYSQISQSRQAEERVCSKSANLVVEEVPEGKKNSFVCEHWELWSTLQEGAYSLSRRGTFTKALGWIIVIALFCSCLMERAIRYYIITSIGNSSVQLNITSSLP